MIDLFYQHRVDPEVPIEDVAGTVSDLIAEGKGVFTGTVIPTATFTKDDIRASIPRFAPENLQANAALVQHVEALASSRGVTPGQVALAWILLQQPWIVRIPGTRRVERIRENAGATGVGLSPDELDDLHRLTRTIGVQGDLYGAAHMAFLDR